MELNYEDKKIIIEDKVITTLDEFVLDFTSILGKYNYVIVHGYVVILFGRARGTEIGTLINSIDKPVFDSLYQVLTQKGVLLFKSERYTWAV